MVITAKQKSIVSTIIGVLAAGSIAWVNCQPEKPIGTLDEMPLGAHEGDRCEDLIVWTPNRYDMPTLYGTAEASSIKVWTFNEVLKASDLNNNFAHIHNTMVGGHGARLVAADVATSLSVLFADAWAIVGTPGGATCDGAAAAGTACAVIEQTSVTQVSSNATAGQYRVNLSYSPGNAAFVVVATSHTATVDCRTTGAFTSGAGDVNGTNFLIVCTNTTTDAATNAVFSFILMDT